MSSIYLAARRTFSLSLVLVCALIPAAGLFAQDGEEVSPLAAGGEPFPWQIGPTKAMIGSIAEIDVPEGYRYTGENGTQMLLELMENPISGTEIGLLMPNPSDDASEEDALSWFVVFEFEEIGYVSDEEKDDLDEDAILESIKQGTEASNEARRSRGWATMEISGWKQKPSYNPQTNNLEWAIEATSDGQQIVNFNTRILGRSGVMSANLVADPAQLSATLPTFRSLLEGYSFQSGQKYGDFREGDKVAEYGLTALVTGGAAAVALKTGLFKKFWKLIVFGFLAVAAFVKRLFGGGSSDAA